jgi:hypothetical protein
MKQAKRELRKAQGHQALLLRTAELQFWLASAVRIAAATQRQPLDLPIEWSHGKHTVHLSDVTLTDKSSDVAAHFMQRSATYLLAVQIRNAIVAVVPDPKTSPRDDIRSAYQVARMTRNAFAHNPFEPTWSIDADCQDRTFTVPGIIVFNTASLLGAPFDWRHYGGPLAFLRLSEWVRREVLEEVERPRKSKSPPTVEYRQQGSLILEKVKPPGLGG